jgi:hypothetical protein
VTVACDDCGTDRVGKQILWCPVWRVHLCVECRISRTHKEVLKVCRTDA